MSRSKGQDRDLRGGGESIGPLRPATPEERQEARERLWEAAERWRYRGKYNHERKRVYYTEVCLALGIMDLDEAGPDWWRYSAWAMSNPGRATRFTSKGETDD